MKILWFSNTPSLYEKETHPYNGCGWVSSLAALIQNHSDIDLAIAFFHSEESLKKKEKITYYPIYKKRHRYRPIKSTLNNWFCNIESENHHTAFLNIIDDFKPDLIHVFGTENVFSSVQFLTKVPVVIHLQGLVSPIYNAYYPNNQSKWRFLMDPQYFFQNLLGISPVFGEIRFKKLAKREKIFLKNARHVMGRTHWDQTVSKLYNPEVNYFHIDEVLRPHFYKKQEKTTPSKKTKFTIISTLSPTIYKGIDVVLKCAKLIKENTSLDFQWNIIGLEKNAKMLKHFEKSEKIRHRDVNICCLGVKNPDQIIELLKKADAFVHPSYIDNSPNSVCEAQIMAVPVIACDVGGVKSLIVHNQTGILIPSNGTFEMASHIQKLSKDKKLRKKLGNQSKAVALQRHHADNIIKSLAEAYQEIIHKAKPSVDHQNHL